MSSYFDNQYGAEDEDNNFNGDGSDSDNESSSSEEEEKDEIEDIGLGEDEENIDDVVSDEDEEDDDDEQSGGAPDDDLEEGEVDEEAEAVEKAEQKAKRTKKIPAKQAYQKPIIMDDDDNDDEEDSEVYLQKFDQSINENYIVDFHPESILQNYDEILAMIKVVRDKNGIIIDDLHRTIPYLTKYEKARILGQRAKQINSGTSPFVKVPENVIDGYIIAELELKEKKIPFIIRRPLPNGGSEYWSIKDLEDISF